MIKKAISLPWCLSLVCAPVLLLFIGLGWLWSERDDYFVEAVAQRQNDWAELLVIFGANVNASTELSNGDTALIYAAESGNIELIHFLIRHGADINETGPFRRTALVHAQLEHQAEAERILLAYGAKNIEPLPGG